MDQESTKAKYLQVMVTVIILVEQMLVYPVKKAQRSWVLATQRISVSSHENTYRDCFHGCVSDGNY